MRDQKYWPTDARPTTRARLRGTATQTQMELGTTLPAPSMILPTVAYDCLEARVSWKPCGATTPGFIKGSHAVNDGSSGTERTPLHEFVNFENHHQLRLTVSHAQRSNKGDIVQA